MMDVETELVDRTVGDDKMSVSIVVRYKIPEMNFVSKKFKFYKGNQSFSSDWQHPENQALSVESLLEKVTEEHIVDAEALNGIISSVAVQK